MYDFICEIKEHKEITRDYRVLKLFAGEIAEQARPGQFVHIRIPGLESASLRRPFSIFNAQDGLLWILYKSVGRGTERMKSLVMGDELQVIGPLGNGFPLRQNVMPLLAAGGYGVAPLYFLATRLANRGTLVVGGRSAEDILVTDLFRDLGWKVVVATVDGSLGVKGLVTEPLLDELENNTAAGAVCELFACGPDGMLRAVGELARSHDCKAWLSLDKHLVCGVGACLACVQKLRRSDGSTWMGRVCSDGPIFEANEIVW